MRVLRTDLAGATDRACLSHGQGAAARDDAAVGERLGDVDAFDRYAAVESGEGSGDAEDPVVTFCAQAYAVDGVGKQQLARLVGWWQLAPPPGPNAQLAAAK